MARKFITTILILLVIVCVIWVVQYNDSLEGKATTDYSAMAETIVSEVQSRGSEAASNLETLGESLDGMISDVKENGIPDLELEGKGEELYESFSAEVADEPKEATDNLIQRKVEEFFSGLQERFRAFIDGLMHG
ncbi:MAG: hypothetical protein K5682_00610 [Lachnospiraceae bacterium]|nr:hypothetical protein [Lachnospiraceae bacterium]